MAKGYKFSLEKLLEIRQDKEEESKREFTESKKAKVNTENELNNLNECYEKYKGIKPGEDVIYQKVKRSYLAALNVGIKQKTKELKIKEKELEIKRQELAKRQVERKTVSRLKEKGYASFIKEQDRIEQLNNDEFALYAYMRKSKGGDV